MNLNRADLIDTVAKNIECTKKDATLVLEAFIETIEKTVANGEKVTLFGFGTFEARKRAARTGRNPINGEAIQIPAKVVPVFSASKAFKEIVNA